MKTRRDTYGFRAVVVKDNPWNKVLAILVGVLLILLAVAILAMADLLPAQAQGKKDKGDKCPDGHTCYLAKKLPPSVNAGETKCMPQEADLGEGWEWTTIQCGMGPTSTPVVVVIEPSKTPFQQPTKTAFQPVYTSTQVPKDTLPVSSNDDDGGGNVTQTPTPTVAFYQLFSTQETCDVCSAVDSLDRIANAVEALATAFASR